MARGAVRAIGLLALCGATMARAQEIPTPADPGAAAPAVEAGDQTPPSDAAPAAEAPAPDAAAPAPEPTDAAPADAADDSDRDGFGHGDAAGHEAGDRGHPHHGYGGPIHYNQIRIDGPDDLTFYYLRQDLFLNLGETDAARFAAVIANGSFGPTSTGSVIQVRPGASYLLLPVCVGQPLGAHRRVVQSNYGDALATKTLACH